MLAEAWWTFTSTHPERQKIVQTYNRYVHFFGTVHPALYTTFALKLACLFGTSKDEVTLRDIPDVTREPKFKSVWARGRIHYRYRNKTIAHIDRHTTSAQAAKATGFKYNDMKGLLVDTCDIFDSAASRLGIDGVPSFSCEGDLLQLIHDLAKASAT